MYRSQVFPEPVLLFDQPKTPMHLLVYCVVFVAMELGTLDEKW